VSDVVFYVCAHTDDALLFRGEGLYTDLHTAGVTTVQVLLTADDAGRTDGWWEAHEAACIESMAGTLTPGTPESGQVTVNGHPIQRHTGPTWALYALRLPDGNVDGNGFPSTGHRTLGKLQRGEIPSLAAIDGSTTYDGWDDLVTTVRGIVAAKRGSMRPWVNTADHDRDLTPGTTPTTTRPRTRCWGSPPRTTSTGCGGSPTTSATGRPTSPATPTTSSGSCSASTAG